ncbi:MAG: gliding motility-associated C-terminal domain-containing protein [Flavobacteriales bacterium]|jgi:gliding motility-associated-like protein|nr:gliding motility-associated C-terminal domain-containing protein [Flavobacteriales bacterium]
MKNKFILFLFLVLFVNYYYTQGGNCLGAEPFCSDQSYTFPASTNTTAQNGPDYSCLSTQPNPAWYYLQIGTAGNIDITLTNSQNEDIDFTCWGPFSSPTAPCVAQLTYDDGNPGLFQDPCGDGGGLFSPVSNYPCGNTVDCSYDPQAVEVVNIPNAQVGDYYILMITNYSGNATDITAQQTGGNGSTDCSIVDPCNISAITTNVSSCDPNTNQYSVNGTISFTDPPASGQLIVEDCSGNQLTYNAPFGTSQNYNFTNLNSTGANCSINAYFTDDLTCTLTQNYNAPAGCMCNADVGTFNISINGSSTNNYVLCDGDQITIQSNNDFTNPLNAGIINGATYDPNLGFAIYFCPPTPNTAPINDPCFSGFFTGTLANFIETNNGGTSPLLNTLAANGVTLTNNTIYLAPITLYNGTTQTYDVACFDIGTAIEITYLQPITTSYTETCNSNSSLVQINGGYPAFDGSNFSISNIQPANISLSSTTPTHNDNITVTGINPGDNYTFDITDNNGCSFPFNGGPFGGISVQLLDTTICNGGSATLIPIVNGGTAPLTYSWDNGTTTNSIVVAPTAPETHCLTILDNAGCSSGAQCVTVNIHPDLNLTVANDTTICLGDQAVINANASGGLGTPYIYTWDNGLGNNSSHTVSPASTTTYNVMIADGCETPVQSDNITVTVLQPPVYTFAADNTGGCPPLPVNFTANDVPNGYQYNWNFGDGGTSTDATNTAHLFGIPGCWDIALQITSPEGCVDSLVLPSYICIDQPPLIDFGYTPVQPTTFAPNVEFLNYTTGATTHEWQIIEASDTTTYLTEALSHQFPSEQGGTYNVCLISTNTNGCSDTLCKTIIVLEDLLMYVPNSFTPDGDGLNDVFIPHISGEKENSYHLKIFNRWGNLIFESSDKNNGWDGTINSEYVKNDTYIWKIEVTDNIKNEEHQYIGYVSLIK